MVLRFSADVRKIVLTCAAQEARRRGDRRLGTDHLLLGLLNDADSREAQALIVDLETARAALDALDRSALAAVGVDVGAGLGRGDLPRQVQARRLLPLTSGARAVLKQTVEETRKARTARIETRQFLLALLDRDCPDPAAELLTTLGVDRSQVRNRLEASGD